MFVIKYFFQWISRTVMVKNNDVDEAMQILNGIMMREGLTKRWKGTRVYEKPTWVGLRIILCHLIMWYITIRSFCRLETEWTMRNAELFTMKIWGTRSDLSWGRTERIRIQDAEQWLVLKHILRRLWTELSFVIHTKYYFAFCFIVAAVGKKNTWLTVNIQMSFTELLLELISRLWGNPSRKV